MTLNQIVVERPHDGFGIAGAVANTESLIRVYTPFDATRYVVWQLHRPAGNFWTGYQMSYVGVGPCYGAKIFGSGYNAAALSYPDGAWGTPSNGRQCTRLYRATGTTYRLRWTADADYRYLLVACNGWNTGCVDLHVTVNSGTATLVRTPLPINNVADSPWRDWGGVVRVAVGMPNYVVVARNIAAGTTLDFTPASSTGQCFVRGLIGVKSGLGDPATADNLVLVPPLVWPGEECLDGVPLMATGQAQLPEGKGITLAAGLNYQGQPVNGSTPGLWGSPQHCESVNNQMVATGTTFLAVTDAAPDGTAWNPAVGNRTAMRQFQVMLSGPAVITSPAAGGTAATYHETWTFTPDGVRWTWELVWNATGASKITSYPAGYSAMLPLLNNPNGSVWFPGASSAPARLDRDDDSWILANAAEALVYGGDFRDAVVRFRPNAGRQGRGQLGVMQRAASGFPDSKLYARQLWHTGGVAVADQEVWTGGAHVQVFPNRSDLLPFLRGGGTRGLRL